MKLPMPSRAPIDPASPVGSVPKTIALYSLLRLGTFVLAFCAAAGILLPSTSGPTAPRILLCAFIAAVLSVPLSLIFGRRLRMQVAAALEGARQVREQKDREYDERIRAGRRNAGTP